MFVNEILFTEAASIFNRVKFYNVVYRGTRYMVKRISERAFQIYNDGIFQDEVTTFEEVAQWIEEMTA